MTIDRPGGAAAVAIKTKAPAEMPTAPLRLHPELWAVVFSYLYNDPSLPPRPAKIWETPIPQPHLASVMRLFNNIASPYLYSSIRTSHLSSLSYGLDISPVPGTPSKRSLLGYTQRLYTQYVNKNEPAYLDLLKYGGAYFYLVQATRQDITTFAAHERGWMMESLRDLWVSGALKRVASLSTGPYAAEHGERHKLLTDRLAQSDHAADRNYLAPIVATLVGCQYLDSGPEITQILPQGLQFRAHIAYASVRVPVTLGGHSRWYYCVRPKAYITTLEGVLRSLLITVVSHALERITAWKQLQQSTASLDPPLHVDVYIPGPGGEERAVEVLRTVVTTEIRGMYKALGIPPTRHAKDIWNFYGLWEAPDCEACGWKRASSNTAVEAESSRAVADTACHDRVYSRGPHNRQRYVPGSFAPGAQVDSGTAMNGRTRCRYHQAGSVLGAMHNGKKGCFPVPPPAPSTGCNTFLDHAINPGLIDPDPDLVTGWLTTRKSPQAQKTRKDTKGHPTREIRSTETLSAASGAHAESHLSSARLPTSHLLSSLSSIILNQVSAHRPQFNMSIRTINGQAGGTIKAATVPCASSGWPGITFEQSNVRMNETVQLTFPGVPPFTLTQNICDNKSRCWCGLVSVNLTGSAYNWTVAPFKNEVNTTDQPSTLFVDGTTSL
ncbi:uncharacterized protein MKK02DRAFT_28473 [Dioszegia hungarica]|uniref:Uncharacterized protein n=1 Tax=Dioszegia hungarica TaxID=4972 RepID=A0AA38H796_9TREE|nr:uncharacterized protein MKK02DRAFT_28473 [Dioszegia hungarica]KAI9633684.1 hypothetical protein MKK02DRAFT_28473 [Dioszegia hungarica]